MISDITDTTPHWTLLFTRRHLDRISILGVESFI